jgi:5'-nucleotidase
MTPLLSRLLNFSAACAVLLGLSTSSSPSSKVQDEGRPRVLVTNDDGIHSPGLTVLVKELSESFDVYVCAPAKNRSGSSHAVTFYAAAMLAREVELEGAIQAIALDATPADAAQYGIVQLSGEEPFDLLISGMNSSSNVGEVSHMSGTVGAAMEGARHRIPSMAVSLGTRDHAPAAAFAHRFALQWLKRGATPEVVYSINIPQAKDGKWKGVRPATMGGNYLQVREYREVGSSADGSTMKGRLLFIREHPQASDSAYFEEGYVTITPLRFDWTDQDALAELADWELE